MPTLPFQPQRVVRNYSNHHGSLGDEAPSQTFVDGNLVSADANGKFAATAAGAPAAAAKVVIAGAAGQNSATPANKLPFQQSDGTTIIDVTAGGAVATAALIKVGAEYGYAIDGTTGIGFLNLADTTNKVYRIVSNTLTRGALGDTNVGVQAVLLPAVRL